MLVAAAVLAGCMVAVRARGEPVRTPQGLLLRGLDGASRPLVLPEGLGWMANLDGYTLEVEGRLRGEAVRADIVRLVASPSLMGAWAGPLVRVEGRLAVAAVGVGLPFWLTGDAAEPLEALLGVPVVVDGVVVAPNTVRVLKARRLDQPP